MKTLSLAKSALVLTLALSIGATTQISAALPTGYTYMEPPPPGYGTVQAPPQKTSAPKQSSTPKSTPPPSYTPQYSAPLPQYLPPYTPTYSSPSQQAPRPATAPKPKTKSSASSYGPLPSSHSLSLAQLAANDRQQDSRIRRLEGDVANLKSGSPSRFVSYDSSPKAHTTYVVRPGDSLWRIASANRVSPGEIMALNHMKSDSVVIGQSLLIPSAAGSSYTTQISYKPLTHSVRAGDTSSIIANKYGVSRESLRAANPRVDFGSLIAGSRINIPGKSVRVDFPKNTTTSSGGSYTVKPGDSLKAIAIRHGTSTANLAAANGIKDANKLIVGQRLIIPGRKVVSNSASKAPSKPKPSAPASDDTIPLPGVGIPTKPMPAPVVKTTPPTTTLPATKPSPAPASDTHRGVLAYRVDSTDSIDSIANQFGTTPQRISEMNHLKSTDKLNAGDEIMVPAMGAVSVN